MIVLDCSAALGITLDTPEGAALAELILSGEKVVAPLLFCAELIHALSKYVTGKQISRDEALEKNRDATTLIDEFYPDSELYEEALSESIRLGHSTYDLFYFILARRTGSTLFTLDKKLAELCMQEGIECVHKITL